MSLAFCTDCKAPLRESRARPTDRGWVCDRDDCALIAHALTTKENPVQPNQHRPVTDGEGDRMMALYRQGGTIVEVAALTGRSETIVKRILRERGVEMRRPGRRRGGALYEVPETSEELAYTGTWVRVGMVWKPVKAA